MADFLAESRALQDVARELNRVKTIGQARGAAGAVLVELSKGYTLAKKVGTVWAAESTREYAIVKRLDSVRAEIEGEYKALDLAPNKSALIPAATWARLRGAMNKAYGELFSLQMTAGEMPTVGGVLRESIQDLPQTVIVATKAVVKAAGDVADAASSWVSRLVWTTIVVVVLAIMLGAGIKKKVGL